MKSTSSFSTILLIYSLSLLSLFPTLTFAIFPRQEIFVRPIPPIPCFPFPPPSKIPSILTLPPYLLEPPFALPPPSRPIPVLRHHLRAWTKRR